MEQFLLSKHLLAKTIPSEDEFYYPLVFNSSLLHSRYIGKRTNVSLKNGMGTLEGIFLGTSHEPLLLHFRKHSSATPEKTVSLFGESEKDWLSSNLKSISFSRCTKYLSNPKEPPYFFVLSDLKEALLFSSYSESEQEDLPEINYNRIITNESIDKLVSFLKSALPKKKIRESKERGKKSGEVKKAKQTHLSRFLKT